jgi:hypothetical protein
LKPTATPASESIAPPTLVTAVVVAPLIKPVTPVTGKPDAAKEGEERRHKEDIPIKEYNIFFIFIIYLFI